MALYIIFPIHVNFPIMPRCVLKATIYRKKTVNCFTLLEKVFISKDGPSIKDVCTLGEGGQEGGGGGSGKSGQMQTGGGVVVSQMWMSALKKNYSYHICEIYSYNLAVCLHIKFSFCLYSIENVWNAM